MKPGWVVGKPLMKTMQSSVGIAAFLDWGRRGTAGPAEEAATEANVAGTALLVVISWILRFIASNWAFGESSWAEIRSVMAARAPVTEVFRAEYCRSASSFMDGSYPEIPETVAVKVESS